MHRLMVIPIRKLGFISSCMLLMAAIVACGGDDEGYSFPCGSSQCQSITISEESVPDAPSAQVIHDTSVTRSQAVRLATHIFEVRKEAGSTLRTPYVLNIQDGNFVVQRYWFEADKQEAQATWDGIVCEWSTDVFDGLQVKAILHTNPGTYTPATLTDYVLSPGQAPPYLVASCGSGLAKEEDVKPASVSNEDSTPKATSTPKVKNYSGCKGLEDLIPNLALPGTVTISYYQVVNLGRDDVCDNIIEKVNKPENLKD